MNPCFFETLERSKAIQLNYPLSSLCHTAQIRKGNDSSLFNQSFFLFKFFKLIITKILL